MQRVCDSWRSTMGSTAIAVVLAYCDATDEFKLSDRNRQNFATDYLEHLRFLYQDSEGDDAKVSTIITINLLFAISINSIEI
jgi:hypothetical protein